MKSGNQGHLYEAVLRNTGLRDRLWQAPIHSITIDAIIGGSDRPITVTAKGIPVATPTPSALARPAPSTACAATPTPS